MQVRLPKAALPVLGCVASLLLSTSVHAAVANGLIAYPCRTTDGHQNICLIDPADPAGTKQQITSGGDNALPAWSPDGQRLAFTHFEFVDGMPSAQIFVMNLNDLSPKSLGDGAAPAWSPDGSRIAFTAPSENGGAQEIWAMNPDGSNRVQLTDQPGSSNSLVTWSPDGQSIAYGHTVPDPMHPILPIHTTIEVTNLLTNFTFDLTAPFTCPGPSLCFQNLDSEGNPIPGQPVLDANSPAWSPTGNEIAYAAGLEGGGVQIWKIDADGNKTQLTVPSPPLFGPYPTNDDPAWSPDGTKILYTSFPTIVITPGEPPTVMAFSGLWVMDADGSNPHLLIENTFSPLPGRAAWQPLLVPEPIAEPASLVLLGVALLGFGLIRRRDRMQPV